MHFLYFLGTVFSMYSIKNGFIPDLSKTTTDTSTTSTSSTSSSSPSSTFLSSISQEPADRERHVDKEGLGITKIVIIVVTLVLIVAAVIICAAFAYKIKVTKLQLQHQGKFGCPENYVSSNGKKTCFTHN